MKAVVLEKKGSSVTVLASDGSFQKIRYRKTVEVGAEIEFANSKQRQPLWRVITSVAAVFLFTFVGSMSWNFYHSKTALAMISVDINPRLQLTIDRKGRVLEFDALNSDAERVLTGLDVKGQPWDQALEKIIGQSVTLKYLNPDHDWVLVAVSPVEAGKKNLEGFASDDIVHDIEGAAQSEGVDPKVAIYQLSAEEQLQAKEQGLTLGEYALMNTAKDAGVEAEASTVKGTKERVDLLEKPQVQQQMVKEQRIKDISNNKGNQDKGNDPEAKNSNDHSNAQPGNGNSKPSDFSRGQFMQEQNEQGKSEEKATGTTTYQKKQGEHWKSEEHEDQDDQGNQGNQGNQGKVR